MPDDRYDGKWPPALDCSASAFPITLTYRNDAKIVVACVLMSRPPFLREGCITHGNTRMFDGNPFEKSTPEIKTDQDQVIPFAHPCQLRRCPGDV
jgi:hypothetical protein